MEAYSDLQVCRPGRVGPGHMFVARGYTSTGWSRTDLRRVFVVAVCRGQVRDVAAWVLTIGLPRRPPPAATLHTLSGRATPGGMEVVGGGESAPNAGGLPIDIPFAKTVGERQRHPSPHAEPFLPSTHTHMHIAHAHARARTHIHTIDRAVQTGSSSAGSSPRARTKRPCGRSTPRSPPLWRRSAPIALASPRYFRPVLSRRR